MGVDEEILLELIRDSWHDEEYNIDASVPEHEPSQDKREREQGRWWRRQEARQDDPVGFGHSRRCFPWQERLDYL